jgi:hypothetical protein
MARIGILINARPLKNPNIEDVLISASLEGMNKEDWRTLSLVVDWFFKHSQIINVDRLTRVIAVLKDQPLVQAFWSGLASNVGNDIRYKRLAKIYRGHDIVLGGSVGESFIKRNGIDQRFIKGKLRVPNKMLRQRSVDILDLQGLVKLNRTAYFRVLVGPSYRADCLQALESGLAQSVSSIAQKAYASYRTAWEAAGDWTIVGGLG